MTERRVLVARLDNVGDVLLAGPAVRAVAASGAVVTMLCSTAGRAAAELLPGVDDVIVFDAPWVGFEPPAVSGREIDRLVHEVRRSAFDEAIVLTSFHQSPLPIALLLRLAGVPRIAAASADYPGSLLDLRHQQVAGIHEVQQSLSLVERAGYSLPPGDEARLAIRRPLATVRPFTGPYVVVHPGASVPARALSPALGRGAVDELVEDGWRVVVTGDTSERTLAAAVAGRHGPDHVVDLAGRLALHGLASVVAGASAVVCGNTGPAHLAAAVGTPVVSVFAPVVDASRWAPWRVPIVLLGDQTIECAGCRARTCPWPVQRCLASVTPRSIARGVRAVARRPSRVPA